MIEQIKYDNRGRPLAICRRFVNRVKCKNQVSSYKDTLCKSCQEKDKKKKKTIQRRQRAIGIKLTRAKKKITWKSKPESEIEFIPTKVFYAKRVDKVNVNGTTKKVVMLKYSPDKEWKVTTNSKINRLMEAGVPCVWNPIEKKVGV